MNRSAKPLFDQVEYLDTVDSTNDYLKRLSGERTPRAVLAGEQTSGRGRQDRKWHSPAGEGLYLSYLLYPRWSAERLPFLTMISALAVTRTLRQVLPPSAPPAVKPPNDVLIRGRKVCGILAESQSRADRVVWAVVGIGINLYQTEFPPQLSDNATSLRLEGCEVDAPRKLFSDLTGRFEDLYRGEAWDRIKRDFDRETQLREAGEE